jgi:hypothetical protein
MILYTAAGISSQERSMEILGQEPVGLRKSKQKFGWARTGIVDFEGQ